MAVSVISYATKAGALGGVTSNAVDTTGANLIVLTAAWFNVVTPDVTIADSKGNTWTPLTKASQIGIVLRLYYCLNPTVGTGHTFSATGTNVEASIGVVVASGIAGYYSQNFSNGGTGTAVQPGSVTPSLDGSLIITSAMIGGTAGTCSINNSFTSSFAEYNSGVADGVAIGYLIQSAKAAINPTWTFGNSIRTASCIAVFSPSAAAAGGLLIPGDWRGGFDGPRTFSNGFIG